jgi:hypothetical protein
MHYMHGWTFDDYEAQPPEVIDAIVLKMDADYKLFGEPVTYTAQLTPISKPGG